MTPVNKPYIYAGSTLQVYVKRRGNHHDHGWSSRHIYKMHVLLLTVIVTVTVVVTTRPWRWCYAPPPVAFRESIDVLPPDTRWRRRLSDATYQHLFSQPSVKARYCPGQVAQGMCVS